MKWIGVLKTIKMNQYSEHNENYLEEHYEINQYLENNENGSLLQTQRKVSWTLLK